ncbi:MAG: UrcA family protein [Gammaproteobacteria bacterium]
MQRFNRTVWFALGVAATLGFSGFANANSEGVRKTEISYGDLDLSHAEQAGALYTRIQRAAHGVCEVNTVPNPQAQLLERKCVARAVDDAVRSIDNPNLTAVYLAKSGKHAMVASSR